MSSVNFNNVVGSVQRNQQTQNELEAQELLQREFKRAKLKTKAFLPFPSLFEIMYTDTEELPTVINGLLRPLFLDFYGSKVEIIQNRQLYATIFFTENSKYMNQRNGEDGPYIALERIIKKGDPNSAESRIQSINHLSSFGRTKIFKLSEKAQELLTDVIPTNFINNRKGKVDWDKLVYENSANLIPGSSDPIPFVQVAVDINRILQCIYGGKSDDNSYGWQYMINVNNPIAPVATPHGAVSNKWQLFITRVNSIEAQQIASQFGFVIGNNNMGIITK